MICDFCYRHCDINEESYGYCQARTVRSGHLEDRDYGSLAAIAVDPVEKKPLYHFLPGTKTLSVAMEGCSLSCAFCQNHAIAKEHHDGFPFMSPETLAGYASAHSIPSISFTYTEPIVWQDYAASAARTAKEMDIRTIMVTNGTFSKQALDRLLPLIDAYNIDLKGDEVFYRDICNGSITPVLNSIARIAEHGSHIEVTTLIIEGIHDEDMIASLGKKLKERGVHVWHITRFFPAYRMNGREATSESFLRRILKAADESGIEFIYPGNSRLKSPLCCPSCGKEIAAPKDGACPHCGFMIYGVWS